MRSSIAPLSLAASLTLLGAVGCGEATSSADASPDSLVTVSTDARENSPEATVRKMLSLARDGEWGAYVDRSYGEQHKFRPGHDDRGRVAEMLSAHAERIVSQLEQIVDVDAEIAADGSTASFEMPDGGLFMLHRGDDGRWTFHL